MGVRCGIDLGTTCSAIAWYNPDYHRAEAISLDHADGLETILSAVYFDAENHAIVGDTAYRARIQHPDRVITGVKRSLGLDFVATPGGTSYAPQAIAAEILKILKADAEKHFDSPVTEAVITIPASFSEQQRLAVKEAGEMAGLEVLELFPDPCAAALALTVDRRLPTGVTHLLVYDLGGDTFSIALVKVDRTDTGLGMTGLNITLLDAIGESQPIGGLVWDTALERLAMQKAREKSGLAEIEITETPDSELLWNCEIARRQLNRDDSCLIPVILPEGRVDITLSRDEFESSLVGLISDAQALLTRAADQAEQRYGLLTEKRIEELAQSGQSRDELDARKVYLLLCGGLTGMRILKECAMGVMGEMPFLPQRPDLLISRGAACRAHQVGATAKPPAGKEKQAGKEPSIEQKNYTAPGQPSAAHVIDMFQSLGLPLTDNGTQIEDAVSALRRGYLRKINNPDPQTRFEASRWFKNIERIKTERATLLGVVRNLFFQMADAAIASDLRGKELTNARYNLLLGIAQEQYRCDEALAKSFVDEYLRLHSFVVGEILEYQRPLMEADVSELEPADVIDMFFRLNLPVTDDQAQIEMEVKKRKPIYEIKARSAYLAKKHEGENWLEVAECLLTSRFQLFSVLRSYFFKLAEIDLRRTSRPGAAGPDSVFWAKLVERAQDVCECTLAFARRLVIEYAESAGYHIDEKILMPPEPPPTTVPPPPAIFVSYSHKDENEKNKFLAHLRVLEKENLIDLWVDDRISAGDDWETKIKLAIQQARVAILFVTVDFLNSTFILGTEVPDLLERRQREGLIVYPVIAKPCAWKEIGWLSKINVKPKNGAPVWRKGGRYADEELAAIAGDIAYIISRLARAD